MPHFAFQDVQAVLEDHGRKPRHAVQHFQLLAMPQTLSA
jgi:hypothetical protein